MRPQVSLSTIILILDTVLMIFVLTLAVTPNTPLSRFLHRGTERRDKEAAALIEELKSTILKANSAIKELGSARGEAIRSKGYIEEKEARLEGIIEALDKGLAGMEEVVALNRRGTFNSSSNYKKALRVLEGGSSIEDVMNSYGLSRGEGELIRELASGGFEGGDRGK